MYTNETNIVYGKPWKLRWKYQNAPRWNWRCYILFLLLLKLWNGCLLNIVHEILHKRYVHFSISLIVLPLRPGFILPSLSAAAVDAVFFFFIFFSVICRWVCVDARYISITKSFWILLNSMLESVYESCMVCFVCCTEETLTSTQRSYTNINAE